MNQKALALAGIGPATPNPSGGEIVRDSKGRAIGALRDRASGLVQRALQAVLATRSAAQVEADLTETVRLAAGDMLSKGVTMASDEGESFQTIDFLKKLVAAKGVPARLWVLVSAASPATLEQRMPQYWLDGFGDDHLSVRGIGEITADGALGTHSAWFLQPYADDPSSTGLNVTAPAAIKAMAEVALKHHFQVSVHAIGDRANHEVLDVFQQIFTAHPEARDLRWRIEHAQHLEASDIPRFGAMHVIASMQSIHACSDGPYVATRLGQARAAEGAYAWRKLLDSGAIIANGTDAPVEDVDPIPNFACAVTRRLNTGETFFPNETMTRDEALRSYTIDAAYALFQDDRLGSIAPGKLADLVVLSKDIMTISVDQIPTARVDDTIVGGKVVYTRQASGSRPWLLPSAFCLLPSALASSRLRRVGEKLSDVCVGRRIDFGTLVRREQCPHLCECVRLEGVHLDLERTLPGGEPVELIVGRPGLRRFEQCVRSGVHGGGQRCRRRGRLVEHRRQPLRLRIGQVQERFEEQQRRIPVPGDRRRPPATRPGTPPPALREHCRGNQRHDDHCDGEPSGHARTCLSTRSPSHRESGVRPEVRPRREILERPRMRVVLGRIDDDVHDRRTVDGHRR